jgi:catechol 2,3-dioxygenase-like lactoylglutathione lyase family enzyme
MNSYRRDVCRVYETPRRSCDVLVAAEGRLVEAYPNSVFHITSILQLLRPLHDLPTVILAQHIGLPLSHLNASLVYTEPPHSHGENPMPLSYLEHFLVQTEDMEKTRNWYVDVLGMRVGPNPDFKFPVCWLYIGEKDVIHITEGGRNVSENRRKYLGQQSDATHGSGVVDHIAFRASGLKDIIAHLQSRGVDFRQRQVDDQGLYQLFMFDPNGIKIELNFPAAEATGLQAEVIAAELTYD